MKKISTLCFLILVFAISLNAQTAKHVILISIDGLRPDFYMDPSWPTPVLQGLKKEGVYAKQVKGVFPTVTYPSHTSIVTGVAPGIHGIYYNAPVNAVKGRWYWNEEAIKVPTLWDAVKKAGLTSAAVMWPVTVGAPIDYNFPVRRADDDKKMDQLAVTRPFVTPAGLLEEISKTSDWNMQASDFQYDNLDRTIEKMAASIFKNHHPNLLAVHFIHADHMQHEHGRDAPEVKAAVATIDSLVGMLLETVKKSGKENETTVIITGDHGFVDVDQTFAPNVLLAKNGLLNKTDEQARFFAAGGSTFLYVTNKNKEQVVTKVTQSLNKLPGTQKKLFRIIDRKELDAIGANPDVAMALAMTKGAAANNRAEGPLVSRKKMSGAHGFYPDFPEISTGFIAVGPGVAKASALSSMSLLDVAPVICKLLGIPYLPSGHQLIPGILAN